MRDDEDILHHEENVDLLPANLDLSAMEMMLVTAMSRETILRSYLSEVGEVTHRLPRRVFVRGEFRRGVAL